MDDDDVFFAVSVFDLLGKPRLEPTGHVRLTGENEQVSGALLGACRKAEDEDRQDSKRTATPEGG